MSFITNRYTAFLLNRLFIYLELKIPGLHVNPLRTPQGLGEAPTSPGLGIANKGSSFPCRVNHMWSTAKPNPRKKDFQQKDFVISKSILNFKNIKYRQAKIY